MKNFGPLKLNFVRHIRIIRPSPYQWSLTSNECTGIRPYALQLWVLCYFILFLYFLMFKSPADVLLRITNWWNIIKDTWTLSILTSNLYKVNNINIKKKYVSLFLMMFFFLINFCFIWYKIIVPWVNLLTIFFLFVYR